MDGFARRSWRLIAKLIAIYVIEGFIDLCVCGGDRDSYARTCFLTRGYEANSKPIVLCGFLRRVSWLNIQRSFVNLAPAYVNKHPPLLPIDHRNMQSELRGLVVRT